MDQISNKQLHAIFMQDKVHIGNLIREKLKEDERSGAWLARKINTDPSNVSKILQRRHIDTELLMKISVALNFDFFNYYSSLLKK